MATLNQLVNELRPTSAELDDARKACENLHEKLGRAADAGLTPPTEELQFIGSVARGTSIRPLEDIDILNVIGEATTTPSGAYAVSKCRFHFREEYSDDVGNISSRRLVDQFRHHLKPYYSRSDLKRDGQALTVGLSSYGVGGISIDVVPAFYVSDRDHFLIPVGGSHLWKDTDPRRDSGFLRALETSNLNCVAPTLQVIKYWFRQKKIVRPRSYHLESIAYHLFSAGISVTSVREGISFFLRNINSKDWLLQCADPTQLSGPISSGLSATDVSKICAAAEEAREHLKTSEEEFVDYINNRSTSASVHR